MLPGWDPNLAFGDGSGTSEVPIPDFDDFFAGLCKTQSWIPQSNQTAASLNNATSFIYIFKFQC
ncbi:hypothetical protein F2Q68_00044543 [Brassica cretica]|uniref:Uncharacterized protein n=1 Tax=Brassica cretica TaxID=69181 RepID=A0A8S9LPB2_BRACR|nr:hypothetical protein F2Q68_00044543 [Brassica cretica]